MKKRILVISLIAVIVIASALFYLSKKAGILKETEQTVSQPQEKKVEEQEPSLPPSVEISPERQQLIGVKTAVVSRMPFVKIIRAVGRVEYNERRVVSVNTKVEGWIEKLYIDYTGRYVEKGEPLAEIYSPELIATQEEFLVALRWTKGMESSSMVSEDSAQLIEAVRQRLRLWDITEEQIKKIEETGRTLRTLKIYSPVSGYVIEKKALTGMKVMPGEMLMTIADLSTVWVLTDIYEYEMPLIKIGQKARIKLSYLPSTEFTARLDYVYPSISAETRTAKIRFEIPNHKGQLKPQMFTDVEIKVDLGKRLSIPEDSVIDTGTRQIVYVDKGEGYFEPKEVILGISADGMREVIKGLKPGEKVVSSATFLVDSEAQLKGIKPLSGHKH